MVAPSIPLENIHRTFYPQSIAVVGANPEKERVGFNLLNSIVGGGYRGKVFPVHPRSREILGLKVYPRLEEIGETPDLVVLAVNQHAAVQEAEKCGSLGVKGLVCVAGGFREVGEEGKKLEKRLIEICRKYKMALVGPNTLGFINTHAHLCSIFYALNLEEGDISFVSQSGGVGLSILMKAMERGLGISKWIGMGNCSVLHPVDYLLYLAEDPHTRVIGIFLEGAERGREFVEVAREVTLKKPVVAYKIGRSDRVENLTMSHTGTMAGSYRMYRDVFNQHGILTAESTDQLVAFCEALSVVDSCPGNRIGILTHTAGPSIVIADQLAGTEAEIPPLSPEALAGVKKIVGDNPPVILQNPLDVAGLGLNARRYRELSGCLLGDPGVDLLIAIYARHNIWSLPSRELVEAYERYSKPVIACYLSTVGDIRKDREYLEPRGIPVYATPEETAWGALALIRRGRFLRKLKGS